MNNSTAPVKDNRQCRSLILPSLRAGPEGAAARNSAHVGGGHGLPVPHAADSQGARQSVHFPLGDGQAAARAHRGDAVQQRLPQLGRFPGQLQGENYSVKQCRSVACDLGVVLEVLPTTKWLTSLPAANACTYELFLPILLFAILLPWHCLGAEV